MKIQNTWLSYDLRTKIKKHFEPIYKRKISDYEIEDIAENLTSYMENIIKFKINYENKQNIA